ncbi:MAG: insulinase family protein [Polyangiaceae bacterium]|nr:insulinase family protein [Polyangiaceae bacterium]
MPESPSSPPPLAGTTLRNTPDAPFREKAPPPEGHITFAPPKINEFKLKNGVRVLLAERHDLPIVSVRVVIGVGAGDAGGARPGLVSFVGQMLEQGTKKRSALAISDDYEAIGASHAAWFDWDSGGASVKVLVNELDAALDILSDVVLAPTFPEVEIERTRARRIASIKAEKSSPGAIAQNVLAPAIFGRAHPYGHTLGGEEADAKSLTRQELVSTYHRLFQPTNATLIVAGDVTREVLQPKLEASFGVWKGRQRDKASKPISNQGPERARKQAAGGRIVIANMPGAQSQVLVAREGARFSNKDRDAIVVTSTILGGMFSSRINLNLREKHAYTYGARSQVQMRHGAGPLLVGASVVADKTVPAIREMFVELDGMCQGGATDEELALAKESLVLGMPGRFETVADVAGAMADLAIYDLPLDEYEKKPARIMNVTKADVKRQACELFAPNAMTVIIVGNKEKLAPELGALGAFGLGAFDERDAYGNPITADRPSGSQVK